MLMLSKSTGAMEAATALTGTESTRSFTVQRDTALISFTGTFASGVCTIWCSPSGPGGPFFKYRADGPDGLPATVSVSSAEVTGADEIFNIVVKGSGQCFKIVASSTPTSVNVWVSDDVRIH